MFCKKRIPKNFAKFTGKQIADLRVFVQNVIE